MPLTLPIENVSFEGVKADLRSYLNSKSDFQDHNFEGSALSLIIDILAYNTHLLAYYASMGFNESFLDSARLRKNVVSIARHLSYQPKSIQAAKATLTLTFTGLTGSLVVPRGTRFRTTIDGGAYDFVTLEAYEFTPAVPSGNIEVYEGTLLTQNSVYTPGVEIAVRNDRVYDQTLRVTVAGDLWEKAENIVSLGPDSKAYFLNENIDQFITINFGDSILGQEPETSAAVVIQYLRTNGPVANGARVFSIAAPVSGFTPAITTVSRAAGGALAESLDSIRKTAPRFYASQNRCVTKSDYIAKISQGFGDIESIAVWGGQESVPVELGKVFISVKPLSGLTLTPGQKRDIIDFITPFKMLNVTPVMIDPVYLDLDIALRVRYNPAKLVGTVSDLQASILAAANSFGDTRLEKFDVYFPASEFTTYIDDLSEAIMSTQVEVTLGRTLDTLQNTPRNYLFDFGNAIVPGSVTPAITGASVNDTTGIVSLSAYSAPASTLTLKATPVELDIFPKRNQLLRFASVTITMVAI